MRKRFPVQLKASRLQDPGACIWKRAVICRLCHSETAAATADVFFSPTEATCWSEQQMAESNSVGFFCKKDCDPRVGWDPDSFQDLLCLTHPLKRRHFLSFYLFPCIYQIFPPTFAILSSLPLFRGLCSLSLALSLFTDGQLKRSGPLQSLRGWKTYSEAVEIKMKSN